MTDALEELQSAVRELTARLRRLEARVSQLEGRSPGSPAASPAFERAEPALSAMAVSHGTIALVGRTLLVLAGAYVARALTDDGVVPPGAGVALGLAYATFWLLLADREAAAGRRPSAVFHALAGSLIAFPLLWETTARFQLLGARASCALLVAFFSMALAVAWRRGLALVAGAATGLTLATAVALLVATHDLLSVFVTLLVVTAVLEWLAYHDRWLPLRWAAALVLDAVALLLIALVTRRQGLPAGYVPLPPAVAAGALLALPALHVTGLAARTLLRGRPVTLFEVAQGAVAVVLGFGGAGQVLTAHGGSTLGLGVLALALASLCYGAAFALADRRAGQARTFYFYSTAGAALALAGANVVAFGPTLPLALGGLGLLAALAGRRLDRMTLRVHSALYLVAGAVETGFLTACFAALAGEVGDPLPRLAWVAAAAAAAAWLVLTTDSRAPRSGWARAPQLLLAVLAVFALGKALQEALWVGLAERAAADAGVAAVLRTAVLAGLALGLALASRRWAWPELGWLVYPVVVLGGAKLLLQDLRDGRPATLVMSLALYGAVLLLAPRLMKVEGRVG